MSHLSVTNSSTIKELPRWQKEANAALSSPDYETFRQVLRFRLHSSNHDLEVELSFRSEEFVNHVLDDLRCRDGSQLSKEEKIRAILLVISEASAPRLPGVKWTWGKALSADEIADSIDRNSYSLFQDLRFEHLIKEEPRSRVIYHLGLQHLLLFFEIDRHLLFGPMERDKFVAVKEVISPNPIECIVLIVKAATTKPFGSKSRQSCFD